VPIKLLFSIAGDFQSAIGEEPNKLRAMLSASRGEFRVSEYLRQTFKNNDIPLSEDAILSTEGGRFQIIDNRNQQTYTISEESDGQNDSRLNVYARNTEKMTANVEIQLIRGGMLIGQLTDAQTGKPIADAEFHFIDDSFWRYRRVKTNLDGVFQFCAVPGTVKLFPPQHAQPSGEMALEIKAGQTVDGLAFQYDDQLDTVKGQVVSSDGKPLANAVISERIAGLDMKRTTTDANGRFSLTVLRGEKSTLVAEDAGGRSRGEITFIAGEKKSVEIRVR
jgi:hypothetical protein